MDVRCQAGESFDMRVLPPGGGRRFITLFTGANALPIETTLWVCGTTNKPRTHHQPHHSAPSRLSRHLLHSAPDTRRRPMAARSPASVAPLRQSLRGSAVPPPLGPFSRRGREGGRLMDTRFVRSQSSAAPCGWCGATPLFGAREQRGALRLCARLPPAASRAGLLPWLW